MANQPKQGDEFFYLDDNGSKADANLHLPMIRRGDIARGLIQPVLDKAGFQRLRERVRKKRKAKAIS